MNSNVTLKSNIYINKTASSDDRDFLRHITDYRILKRLEANSSEGSRVSKWMTATQRAILSHGQPNCSLEHGTMSWGVPVGSNRFVCRCEEYMCGMFNKICSKYSNFESVQREAQLQAPVQSVHDQGLAELRLYRADEETRDDEENKPVVENAAEPALASGADTAAETAPQIMEPTILAEEPALELTDELHLYQVDEETRDDENNKPVIENTAVPAPVSGANMAAEATPQIMKLTTSTEGHALELTLVDGAAPHKVPCNYITEQSAIINADISERIWVNAGPGTGKTYTVIQRLNKLLRGGLDCTILVLCFSRNAVQVIRDRLYESLGYQADIRINDGQLMIRTFDSFATYMLEDELNPAWDYNKRIEEFISMLGRNTGALDGMLGYLIVDEIQDTVGIRARMLLAMLDELSCGVLLLGDRCQSIFDWTIKDSNDMSFDLLTKELEKRQFIRCELTENRRQTRELAVKGQELREIMLQDDVSAQETAFANFKNWAKARWHGYNIRGLSQCLSGSNDLILCKTNGEAAHISQVLFESASNFNHIMKQSSNHRSLAGWIAKVLSGNDGHIMDKSRFWANAADYDVENPAEKWSVLKALDGHDHAPGLHIPEVLSALSKLDGLPDICLNTVDNCVIISTVHRAKGSEAEYVYWMDSPLVYGQQQENDGTLSDALKAAYVAVTRAKTGIHMLEPDERFYMKSVREKRWIQTGYGKNKKPFCKGIALLPEDVDATSFVDKEYAEVSQSLLACLEPGVSVDLYPNASRRCFEIYFDGQPIGRTSKELTDALFAGFEATNYNRNWPASIRNAFITAITTVTGAADIDIDEQYRTAGCWLGMELGGFPNIEWY